MRRIMEHAHAEVVRLLTGHREKLDSLSEALLATATRDEGGTCAAAGVPRERTPEPAAASSDGAA